MRDYEQSPIVYLELYGWVNSIFSLSTETCGGAAEASESELDERVFSASDVRSKVCGIWIPGVRLVIGSKCYLLLTLVFINYICSMFA